MTDILLVVLIFVMEGGREALQYGNGWQPPDNNSLFGYFSLKYHLPLAVAWLSVCILSGYWWLFPGMCQIQDAFYFAFNRKDDIDAKDWVTAGLGGFYVGKQYIPFTYVALWLGSLGLYYASVLLRGQII